MPERVKIEPYDVTKVLMNFNMYIHIPKDTFGIIVLSLSLQKESLVLKDYQHKKRKVELELFSKTHNTTLD